VPEITLDRVEDVFRRPAESHDIPAEEKERDGEKDKAIEAAEQQKGNGGGGETLEKDGQESSAYDHREPDGNSRGHEADEYQKADNEHFPSP
jgi:hypothetical protein